MPLTRILSLHLQYGFVKNRRGPEVDVYSNAKFNRGDLDMLSHLTKRKPTESKKMQEQKSLSSPQNNASSCSLPPYVRTVSPTISFVGQEKFIHVTDTSSTPINTRGLTHSSLNIQPNSPPLSYQKICASVSMPSHVHNSAHLVSPSNKPCQGGRLDLLAEAMRTVIANERSSFEREFAWIIEILNTGMGNRRWLAMFTDLQWKCFLSIASATKSLLLVHSIYSTNWTNNETLQ